MKKVIMMFVMLLLAASAWAVLTPVTPVSATTNASGRVGYSSGSMRTNQNQIIENMNEMIGTYPAVLAGATNALQNGDMSGVVGFQGSSGSYFGKGASNNWRRIYWLGNSFYVSDYNGDVETFWLTGSDSGFTSDIPWTFGDTVAVPDNATGSGALNRQTADALYGVADTNAIVYTDDSKAWPLTYSNKVHVLLIGQSLAVGNATGVPKAMDRDYIYMTTTWTNDYVGVPGAYIVNLLSTNMTWYTGPVRMRDYNNLAGWGYEIGASEELTKWNRTQVYWSKWGVGGTALASGGGQTWDPQDNDPIPSLYSYIDDTLTNTAAIYPAAGDVDVVVWSQGEADAGSSVNANAYYSNLTNLIATLRADLGNPTLPWVVMGLTDQYAGMEPYYSANYGATVRAALKRVAEEDPYVTFCDMHGEPRQYYKTNHLTHEGNWNVSKKIAGAILGALGGNQTKVTSLNVEGMARAEAGRFDQYIWSKEINGRYGSIDYLDDIYGPVRSMADGRGLVAYIEATPGGLVDRLGNVTGWLPNNQVNEPYSIIATTNIGWEAHPYSFVASGQVRSVDSISALHGSESWTVSFDLMTPQVTLTTNDASYAGRVDMAIADPHGGLVNLGTIDTDRGIELGIYGATNGRRIQTVYDGGFKEAQNSMNYRDGWINATVTYDAANTQLSVYYDGDLAGRWTQALTDTLDGRIFVGGTTNSTPTGGGPSGVRVDKILVWNRALSEQEAMAVAGSKSAGGPGAVPSQARTTPKVLSAEQVQLCSLWDYSDPSIDDVWDLVGDTAENVASLVVEQDSNPNRGWVQGNPVTTFRNNTTTSFNHRGGEDGELSFTFWVKWDGSGTTICNDVLTFRNSSNPYGLFFIGETNAANIAISDSTDTSQNTREKLWDKTVDLTDWRFIGGTINRATSNTVIYVDGEYYGSYDALYMSVNPINFYFNDNYWQPSIPAAQYNLNTDLLGIYGRELSPDEFRIIYEHQLQGQYGFDELDYGYYTGIQEIITSGPVTNKVSFQNGRVLRWE